jgi:hypothetical protein
MRRIAAIAAITGALALGACGGDDESTTTEPATAPKSATITRTDAPDATITDRPGGPGETATAPKSATIPSSGAPDSGISDRPGGPGDGGY